MKLSKKQLILIYVVIFLVIVATIARFFVLHFDIKADETATEVITSTVTATFESDGKTYTVNSEPLVIKYNFVNLPTVEIINLVNDQVITANPYIISVKVANPEEVSKVDFYIDNILIGTSTLPDVNGVFECAWDTSQYHSAVKIVVTDIYGRPQEFIRNTTVSLPSPTPTTPVPPIVYELPKTGE